MHLIKNCGFKTRERSISSSWKVYIRCSKTEDEDHKRLKIKCLKGIRVCWLEPLLEHLNQIRFDFNSPLRQIYFLYLKPWESNF